MGQPGIRNRDFPEVQLLQLREPLQVDQALEPDAVDGVGVGWTRERKCITCHTNMPYLTARPLLKGDEGWKEVRLFLEKDVESWSNGGKPRGDAYVVATAFALAFNDAQKTGELHAATKAALDRMWESQKKTGEWDWLKCDWPPLEAPPSGKELQYNQDGSVKSPVTITIPPPPAFPKD